MITLNGYKVEPTIFPDGTSQVWHLPADVIKEDGNNVVKWWFESEAEVMHMCQLNYLIGEFPYNKLIVPYFPYARQDKEPSNDSSFALFPFLDIMSGWPYVSIHSYDVHFQLSEMPCENMRPPHLQELCDKYHTIIFPDKGAAERYKWIQHPRKIDCSKVRDQATGRITNFYLNNTPDYGMTLVVDDLCDGGATFNILAESIAKTYGAHYVANLDLYVTHGIFSKGIDDLLRWYGQIHTTNTYIKNQTRHHRLFIEQIC